MLYHIDLISFACSQLLKLSSFTSVVNVLVGSEVDGTLSVKPNNTTSVPEGQLVMLRCHSDVVTPVGLPDITWIHTRVDGTQVYVASGCAVYPLLASNYSLLVNVTTGQCDLVINNTQPALTGLYDCTDTSLPTVPASAYVTIIGQLLNIFYRDSLLSLAWQ